MHQQAVFSLVVEATRHAEAEFLQEIVKQLTYASKMLCHEEVSESETS